MNKNILRSLIMTVALSATLAGTASADQMWNFASLFTSSQHNTSLGSSYTFTQGTSWLKATAVVPMWSASTCASTTAEPCLFAKFTKGDPSESGLGLEPNVNDEIFHPDGIALQASGAIASIVLGSVQGGESWALVGCSATFGSCTLLKDGIGGTKNIVTLTGLSKDPFASYIVYVPCANKSSCFNGKTDSFNNIVLMSATTVVPEPGTLALFGAGLLGCALFVGRRRRSSQTRA